MSYSLLQLVQQVTAELNLPVPSYVIGNTSQDTQQILALIAHALVLGSLLVSPVGKSEYAFLVMK